MRKCVKIENIDAMRREAGIDDVELREEIRDLKIGDHVMLTFLNEGKPWAAETLSVRITRITGPAYRGKLAEAPASVGLASLRLGSVVVFSTAHIHSIAREQPTHARAD